MSSLECDYLPRIGSERNTHMIVIKMTAIQDKHTSTHPGGEGGGGMGKNKRKHIVGKQNTRRSNLLLPQKESVVFWTDLTVGLILAGCCAN